MRIGRKKAGLGAFPLFLVLSMLFSACLPAKKGALSAHRQNALAVNGGIPMSGTDSVAPAPSTWERLADWTRYHPDPNFVDLYAELKLASVALSQDLDKASEIRRVILAQHGMTPAEFHEHFMRLADHPEAWRPFQERVVARIDALQPKPVATGKE